MPIRLAIQHFRSTFRALRHRNFRLFLSGQVISLAGTWMQRVGVAWLVYRLTGSALLLGVIGFCGQIPALALGPVAGWAADRFDRYKLLLWTQVLEMAQALTLAALVLGGRVQIWHLVVLSLLLGIAGTFEVPARQAFVIRMIDDKADLGNAIALHSSAFNAARLVGPTLAGFLIAHIGEEWVFLLNGLSFVAVIWGMTAMRIDAPPRAANRAAGGAARHMIEGFRYAFGAPAIRVLLVLLGLVSLVGMPHAVLMPIVADRFYHGGAHALGLLMGASGLGALVGAVALAGRRTAAGLNRSLAASGVFIGLSLLAMGLVPPWPVALALLFIAGWAGMHQVAASNTILQTLVSEDQRGRVMSFFSMAVLGMMPLGHLLSGAVADRYGVPMTLALGGAATLVAALALSRAILRIRIPSSTPAPASLINKEPLPADEALD